MPRIERLSSEEPLQICGVIVLYYPNIETVKENIVKFLPWIEHLIVWDNTPKTTQSYIYSFVEYSEKISYLSTGKNEGIAYALNKAVDWAEKKSYTHILTMDQDSQWYNFKNYRDEINNVINERWAAFAPLIYDATRKKIGFNTEYQFITSGAVYDIRSLRQIGPFCEEFKIDCVDTEYALRIRNFNHKFKIIKDSYLKQNFGNLSKVPFLNCFHANYSEFRLFHIVRNNIWMWKMYKHTGLLPGNFIFHDVLYNYLIREPFLIFLVGHKKVKKFKALIKGLLFGFFSYPSNLSKYLLRTKQ